MYADGKYSIGTLRLSTHLVAQGHSHIRHELMWRRDRSP